MSSNEALPNPEPSPVPPRELIYPNGEEGPMNEELFYQTFGLTPEEAKVEISFGPYKGPVSTMLLDPKCPVGQTVHEAYQEKGLTGVKQLFDSFAAIDPSFKNVLDDRSGPYDIEKKT